MRRPRSHAAHRATSNPFSNSTEPEEELRNLPSLEPEGKIPEYAIQGDSVVKGHNIMVKKFKDKGPPPPPKVVRKFWVEVAKEKL
eukprot:9344916-Karenia_brevis.AAC.1